MIDNITFLHQKAVEAASEGDRIWFEQNPDRSYRLRDPLPMEMNGPLPDVPLGYDVRIVVSQITSGVRTRTVIGLRADVPNEGAEDHHIAELFRRYAPEQVTCL